MNLSLEEVSARTGIPVAELRKQQLQSQMLREKRPLTQGSPTPAPVPKYNYSPQGGPLRLQKQMQDSGL
jgi:hypothetical protein